MQIVENKIKTRKLQLTEVVNVYAIARRADWLTADDNFAEVNTAVDADLIIFPGGADINPALYKEPIGRNTWFSEENDARQLSYYKPYVGKKRFFGICRGLQLLTAMAGGKLVQDMSHPSYHRITTCDGRVLSTNSIHHQQAYLKDMPEDSYKLLAWAEKLSDYHMNGNDKDYHFPDDYKEPEVVYYPKINAMGIQGHPEMGGMPQETRSWLIEQIKKELFHDKLVVE